MQFSHRRRAHKKIVPKPQQTLPLRPPSPLMASAADPRDGGGGPADHISSFLRTASTRVSSFLTLKPPSRPPRLSLKIHTPLRPHSPPSLASPPDKAQTDSLSSNPSKFCSTPSSEPGPEFPSGTRISTAKGGEPAFVGRVYSIYDGSGSDLVDTSSHFHIPFLSKRTPEWLKEMFATVTKSDKNSTGSRFFMDWDHAVSYLQEHYIPNGVVGNCNLDSAYEHYKEKPHLVQFVSNERQVNEANKLLKTVARGGDGKKNLDGVPVFSSQNLDLLIETTDGIKRYTPYFFDKNLLDSILEASVDHYFQSLIARRDTRRWRDDADGDVDHNHTNEVVEEMGQSTWDLPEVQEVWHEVSDEMDHPGSLPLNLLPKLAEIEILYAVDKILLGNRWLRKATGIQPKFPYVVDSFERKSAASFRRANKLSVEIPKAEFDNAHEKQAQIPGFQFPFGNWLTHPWLDKQQKQQSLLDTRAAYCTGPHRRQEEVKPSPLLPKVTIVDISTEEPETSSASSKKAMRDLLEELEQEEQSGPTWSESMVDERDPLFVADFEALSAWYSSPRVG